MLIRCSEAAGNPNLKHFGGAARIGTRPNLPQQMLGARHWAADVTPCS